MKLRTREKHQKSLLRFHIMKPFDTANRSHLVIFFVLLVVVAFPWVAAANSALTQSYLTEERISLSSIVSIKPSTNDTVIAATTATANNILGVVINEDNSLVKLSGGNENQVQVSTSGIAQVLVSDINGDIVQGDYITASPIAGVGMKATSNIKVVGIAQGNLVDASGSTETYIDQNDEEQQVTLGQIPILVDVSHYFKEPDKTLIPPAIQNLANALAGKTVRPLPIIVSAAIFVVTLIAVASILFSMIRSSIISVGRNPMSQAAVYRNVLQISALVLVILSVAVISIYLVLTGL